MTEKRKTAQLVPTDEIEKLVRVIRGQRVMLDSDLAKLYGVTTAALNQAVQRNADRFPDDFSYLLTHQEFTSLISQIVISKPGRGGHRKPPRVFTEHGVAMLSSVLRSPTAIRVNIEIMRAFVRLRRLMATPGELVEQVAACRDSQGSRRADHRDRRSSSAIDGAAAHTATADWFSHSGRGG